MCVSLSVRLCLCVSICLYVSMCEDESDVRKKRAIRDKVRSVFSDE